MKRINQFFHRHPIALGLIVTIVALGGASSVLAWSVQMDTPQLVTTTTTTTAPTETVSAPVTKTVTPVAPTTTTTTTVTTPVSTTVPEAPSTFTPTPSAPVSDLSDPSTGQTTTTSTTTAGSEYESTNWSGYVASDASYTGVSGDWTVPSPTSTSATQDTTDAAWIGIGGASSSDLIQIGTDDVVSPSGATSVQAFYELLPDAAAYIPTLTVNPGDQLAASITETGTDLWTITLTDTTTGQAYSNTISYASSLSTAEWIEEVPSYTNGRLTTLDNFGTVAFTNAKVIMNGVLTGLSGTNPSSITMLSNRQPIAIPSALSDDGFTVTYQP